MTTSSINLDYRLLPCGCCFRISLKGLPICHTADPIVDAALFLKDSGVADETTITMSLDGSDMGIRYSLHDVISASEYEPDEAPKSDKGSKHSIH